jgi:hypothetical protein
VWDSSSDPYRRGQFGDGGLFCHRGLSPFRGASAVDVAAISTTGCALGVNHVVMNIRSIDESRQIWTAVVGQRLVGGNMRTLVVISMALAVELAASNTCVAQVIVKQEPMEGQLRTGVTVLVDDGTCGRGKIKLITSTGGDVMKGLPQRTRTCIPSQAANH